MKMKKNISILILLLSTTILFSQSKLTANRYFQELAYKKASEAYTNLYNRGNESYNIISRIADSYYFNSKTQEAEQWYKTLGEKYSLKEEHLFRYAHALKGNKKYTQADSIINKLKKINNDNRTVKELLNNPNYYSVFKTIKKDLNSFENLSVNSKYSDFGGFIFNEQLYFASSRPSDNTNTVYKWNEQPFLNLYKGNLVISGKGTKKEAINVKDAVTYNFVKTKFHESNTVFTKDGKTMYFTRDNFNNGKKRTSIDKKMRLKLYRSILVDGKWSEITELPFNSDEYSTGHPALSPDEKTLYFVSDRPGGFGATDIYKVSIDQNGNFGSPVNLGETINTKGREMFPYVSADNTLYLSSDGHLGLGGLDTFESLIFEDGSLGKVENLQAPFNSSLDDFGFYIDIENKRGFISSNRKGGKGDDDIYSFVLTNPKRRPDYDCKKTVSGIVVDAKSGAILPEATVKIFDEEGMLLKEKQSDEKGTFSFVINCKSDQYKVRADKDNYRKDIKVFDTETYDFSKSLQLALEPFIVDVVKNNNDTTTVEKQIVIRPIYFNFNRHNIRPDSEYELEHIVDVMKSNPDMVIKIESHTDSRGTKSYNKILSRRRAVATKKYILSRGISSSRIQSAIGYGESQLLNRCNDANKNNCSEEEHQLNRRSYFIIVSGGVGVKVENTPPTVIDRKKR